jgi:hypothetical protein
MLRPADTSSLLVKQAIMKGVALYMLVAHKLPIYVACLSTLATDAKPVTSHRIEIGVTLQFKPDTVYMSCSVVTFNDNK